MEKAQSGHLEREGFLQSVLLHIIASEGEASRGYCVFKRMLLGPFVRLRDGPYSRKLRQTMFHSTRRIVLCDTFLTVLPGTLFFRSRLPRLCPSSSLLVAVYADASARWGQLCRQLELLTTKHPGC